VPIEFAPPCAVCRQPYLDGTQTTCQRCLRAGDDANPRQRTGIHFRCYCGRRAVAVMLVSLGHAEAGFSLERIPLCRECLKVERETQRLLSRRRAGPPAGGASARRVG
jgi:hypothetical protein